MQGESLGAVEAHIATEHPDARRRGEQRGAGGGGEHAIAREIEEGRAVDVVARASRHVDPCVASAQGIERQRVERRAALDEVRRRVKVQVPVCVPHVICTASNTPPMAPQRDTQRRVACSLRAPCTGSDAG